jgi:hypothetical protein
VSSRTRERESPTAPFLSPFALIQEDRWPWYVGLVRRAVLRKYIIGGGMLLPPLFSFRTGLLTRPW